MEYTRSRENGNRSVDANYEKCRRHNKQLNDDKTNIYGVRIRMRKCSSEQHKLCVDDCINEQEKKTD